MSPGSRQWCGAARRPLRLSDRGGAASGGAGTNYLGGGGGGQNFPPGGGGNGGTGVVFLRIPTSKYSGTTAGTPTVTTDGADTVLKYTGSGSYTPV